MTIPVLPSQFKPIFGSYTHGGASGVSRTDVAGGAARYALEFDRGFQKWNVTLNTSDAGYSAWVAFYHRTINKGAITFQMNLDSGFGLEPHFVNIVPDTYSASSVEWDRHIISFVCEGESTVYNLTDGEADAVLALYVAYGDGLGDAGIPDFLDILERFATVDSNILNF